MNTNTFDGSQPVLVSYDTIRDIESKINVPFDGDENRVLDGLGHFYNEYVLPNMFPLLVISILCIYLIIKYILKQDREEKEREYEEYEKNKRSRAKSKKNQRVNAHHEQEINQKIYQEKIHQEKIHEQMRRQSEEDQNIADYISDDYLLTETDELASNAEYPNHSDNPNPSYEGREFQELQISESNPMMSDMIAMHGGMTGPFADAEPTNKDKVSKMVFGEI